MFNRYLDTFAELPVLSQFVLIQLLILALVAVICLPFGLHYGTGVFMVGLVIAALRTVRLLREDTLARFVAGRTGREQPQPGFAESLLRDPSVISLVPIIAGILLSFLR